MTLVGVLVVGKGFAANTNTVGTHPNTTVTAAQGQRRGRNWDGYPNLGGSNQLRQTALNAGYNEGSKEGRNDRNKRTYRNYGDFKSYRNADQDYSSKLGDRDLYQRYYRMAFESGYDTENPSSNQQPQPRDRDRDYDRNRNSDRSGEHRGRNWDRYGAYGGSTELRQTALNAGYNAGIKEGRSDGKRGRHRNYSDFGAYQKATDDYSSKLGDKELYRRYYREGFENGYEDGYRGY
jgi:hypothetical protein